jgi:hypothetical protein
MNLSPGDLCRYSLIIDLIETKVNNKKVIKIVNGKKKEATNNTNNVMSIIRNLQAPPLSFISLASLRSFIKALTIKNPTNNQIKTHNKPPVVTFVRTSLTPVWKVESPKERRPVSKGLNLLYAIGYVPKPYPKNPCTKPLTRVEAKIFQERSNPRESSETISKSLGKMDSLTFGICKKITGIMTMKTVIKEKRKSCREVSLSTLINFKTGINNPINRSKITETVTKPSFIENTQIFIAEKSPKIIERINSNFPL